MLQQRFGQPHIVAKACVDALVDGPDISNNDEQGVQEFADRSRTLYETLRPLNALSEMNMSNLAKMAKMAKSYLLCNRLSGEMRL